MHNSALRLVDSGVKSSANKESDLMSDISSEGRGTIMFLCIEGSEISSAYEKIIDL